MIGLLYYYKIAEQLMTYTRNRFGPTFTPKIIKILISIVGGVGIISALLYSFGFVLPQLLLSLSLPNFMIWQPLTYWMVQNSNTGISFSFLIGLIFNLYLIWIIGSSIINEIGVNRFLRFCSISTIGIGITALITIKLTGHTLLFAGPEPIIYGLLILWMMLNPELELLLLMTFPVKIKWLVTIFLGIIIVVDFAHGNWPYFIAYLTATGGAYLYCLLACKLQSPFIITHRFDSFFNNIGILLSKYRQKKREIKEETYRKAKIYDFKTGKALLDDEQFMDAMLSKISQHGEKSLTIKEKLRMQKISKRMKK